MRSSTPVVLPLVALLVLVCGACSGCGDGRIASSEVDAAGSTPEDDGGGTNPGDPDGGGINPGDLDGGGTNPGDPDGGGTNPGDPDAGTMPPSCVGNGTATQPFGNHAQPLAAGAIVPNHLPQASLDDATRDFYDDWKSTYLRQGCGAGRYYVETNGPGDAMTVSEAHGFGMVIVAFMAGHDPDAQTIFDGMVEYFWDHPSDINPGLMAWSQDDQCDNSQGGTSATDGDLDIAYALLLADKQWGSNGAIDYHGAAMDLIAAIWSSEVDSSGSWTLLGDWPQPGSTHYDATRTSDFMPGHFESFDASGGVGDWAGLRDSVYAIVDDLQSTWAAGTGLLPDFVVDPGGSPSPAPGGFLEGGNDGNYAYNACRDPWRIGVHFVTTGDVRSRDAAEALSNWIASDTGGDPAAVHAGYSLDGDALPGSSYVSMAFIAPFGVAAMVDSSNQAWLDDVWDVVAGEGVTAYYEDSIKMLSMIAMSGNWWVPEAAPCP